MNAKAAPIQRNVELTVEVKNQKECPGDCARTLFAIHWLPDVVCTTDALSYSTGASKMSIRFRSYNTCELAKYHLYTGDNPCHTCVTFRQDTPDMELPQSPHELQPWQLDQLLRIAVWELVFGTGTPSLVQDLLDRGARWRPEV